ncbi:glycosyltransferase family 4 protein [Prochlorococcus sp. MIT 1011]|uniref:glycosyltransferase family 4 protein n=1 Tax=Prochlorococcus sp. MIT 1011 TaxID=3082520 RepID=UPI0039B41DF4
MNIIYISPSFLPSDSANSIHVLNQVQAIAKKGHKVTLFAARNIFRKKIFENALYEKYFPLSNNIKLSTIFSISNRSIEFFIALDSIIKLIFSRSKYIISRNLYASLFLSLSPSKNHIYEMHEILYGVRGQIQKFIINNKNVKLLCISKSLANDVRNIFCLNNRQINILHDAAPSFIEPVPAFKKRKVLFKYIGDKSYSSNFICVYSGAIQKGRGIEIINELAMLNKNVLFLVVGGSAEDLRLFYLDNIAKSNLIFLGRRNYRESLLIASCADILLMPYQNKVLINNLLRDTSRWMSPLKMFEYMAMKNPIISSDVSVLKEILIDRKNALLVPPDNINSWSNALNLLIKNNYLREELSINARNSFLNNYSWDKRGENLLSLYD